MVSTEKLTALLVEYGYKLGDHKSPAAQMFHCVPAQGCILLDLCCGPREYVIKLHELDNLLHRLLRPAAFGHASILGGYNTRYGNMLVHIAPVGDADIERRQKKRTP